MRIFSKRITAVYIHNPSFMKTIKLSVPDNVRSVILAGAIIALASCGKPSGIQRVWAVDDSEKIKQEDIDNPLASDQNNSVWKNNTVSIFGGRNETVAFQLIIQADDAGAKDVNVVISDLVNGNSVIHGSATGSSDPFDYRGRNTELFTEHYLNMVKRSPPLWFFARQLRTLRLLYWLGSRLSDPIFSPTGKRGSSFCC